MKDRIKVCAFCSNPADSKEHWPPAWTKSVMGWITGSSEHAVSYEEGPVETGFNHQTGVFFKTFKVVCSQCNNEWMGEVTDKSKYIFSSILSGNRSINHLEADTLRRWLITHAIVYEYADFRTFSTGRKIRESFKEGIELNHWRVYIGRIGSSYRCATNRFFWKESLFGGNMVNKHITAIVIGPICAMIFCTSDADYPIEYSDDSMKGFLRLLNPNQATQLPILMCSEGDFDEVFRESVPPYIRKNVHIRGMNETVAARQSGRQRGSIPLEAR